MLPIWEWGQPKPSDKVGRKLGASWALALEELLAYRQVPQWFVVYADGLEDMATLAGF